MGWQLASVLAVTAGLLSVTATAQQKGHKNTGAGSDTIITLKNDFIEKYKERVTIEADYSVDTLGPVHKVSKGGMDGDMHFSGRADSVGLPTVLEIMNAKHEKPAVKAVKAAQGKGPVKVAGAWRLWCEHANNSKQVQGEDLDPFTVSNPDHVFEVHPVTRFGKVELLDSVDVIDGYKYYDAETAFLHYANVKCHITSADDGTTTLRTQAAGYNYVEFLLESLEEPKEHLVVKGDGRFLRANVRDTEGELVARNVRMAFIEGTAAEQAVRSLGKNGRLHVKAIPRIDLALVSWRVKHKDDPKYKADQPLDWNLPYEMIVVGVVSGD
jgi:hypothetical protein